MRKVKLLRSYLGKIKNSVFNYVDHCLFLNQAFLYNNLKLGSSQLIILDDIFPLILSTFRVAEYNEYLKIFPNSIVYTTGASIPVLAKETTIFHAMDEYARLYPQLRNKIERFNPHLKLRGKLVYTIFINNIYNFFPCIQENSIPFIFTLYPGGGFYLYDEESDRKLRIVCSSPLMKKVIVTQKVTYDYLIDNDFCSSEQIEFIYGVVTLVDTLTINRPVRKIKGKNKQTFDICFVAHKYMPCGIDKGYDTFIEVTRAFSKRYDDIRFHIVGNFSDTDIDVGDLNNITFYGSRSTSYFLEFFSGMDIILAPNVPFMLHPGAFDGFPTASCIEASLSGVAMFCSDILNQNVYFTNKKDIVLINNDVNETVELLEYYYNNYDELQLLAQQGSEVCKWVYSTDFQMQPRINLLKNLLE